MSGQSLREALAALCDEREKDRRAAPRVLTRTLRRLLAEHPETDDAAPVVLDRDAVAKVADIMHRAINAALCNSDVPGWTLHEEAVKAADAVCSLAGIRTVAEVKAEALEESADDIDATDANWVGPPMLVRHALSALRLRAEALRGGAE